ncbi:alanine racemase [Marinobacter halodurans]|uniref:Alanine racemase n=1 Tax=Marinobacter halodurans TaxID=2528979 RepID=A0ABY1ZPU6_9GAMM|nr:alanine racemase [Marinobacter halodurans]TBW56188.1 alanine racemase [Marinobacter halodurans]
MGRHTRARIDLSALRHNFALAERQAGTAEAMAVVKADGYGHGLEPVARALADQAGRFAVACLEEAERLREAGIRQPIVLLQGFHDDADVATCADLGLEPVIHSDHQLAALENAAATLTVWLKVNTGMNRLGFAPEQVEARVQRLRAVGGVTLKGMVTHYACADDREDPMTDRQNDMFSALSARYPELEFSAANSAGHFRVDSPRFHWTRPGIMLYGATPMIVESAAELGLRAVMSLESRLTATRVLQPGECVGYGATWRAARPTPMGIVSIGYGDGYPRHAPTGTPVWVAGTRTATLGRVSMDMLAVDLTAAPHARPGDRVELWGANVPVDEVARCAGTIGYELLTGVTARVPRVYTE